MATIWVDVSPADVTGIGTAFVYSTPISVAPNEALTLDVQMAGNGAATTVRVQQSVDGVRWGTLLPFEIPASDTSVHPVGSIMLAPNVRIGFALSSGAGATASIKAQKGPFNAA